MAKCSGREVASLASILIAASALIVPGAPAWGQSATAEPAPARVPRTAAEAPAPEWPQNPKPKEGAPNVILILTDDVGFGASSTFGGPIPTPTFDTLARTGIRYNQYNNASLCSPTRAALLTGRNPHNVAMGHVTNIATGYEGYTSVIPKSAGTVAQILKQAGYNTAGFGKWHLTPEWEETAAGPFDRWPSGLGFEYFYGFHSGDANQYAPRLMKNNHEIYKTESEGYILDKDIADHAVEWIRTQQDLAPDKPFFLYYAPGTAHAPHHAPADWIARFRGKFDQGWDKMREEIHARQRRLGVIPGHAELTPRPDELPAWSSLSPDEQRVAARLMESYAAALAYSDDQIGRLVDALRKTGELDNTLIIYIQGDNGASAEGGLLGEFYEQSFVNGVEDSLEYRLRHLDEIGGPKAYNHFPAGWAWATNAPFQYYKQIGSHFGGLRDGLVMSWPDRIKADGRMRQQFHFVSDIMPTILDAAGVEAPGTLDGTPQMPLDGISMTYTFDQPGAPSRRKTQVFEMLQNLAIYQDGWWAATKPVKAPWEIFRYQQIDPDARQWELYDITRDYSQAHDLAEKYPEKLATLKELFWKEAERNRILPLHDPSEGTANMPTLAPNRSTYVYTNRTVGIPRKIAPRTNGRSFAISAELELSPGQGRGVIVTQGGRFGGYTLYLKDGKPVFHYNSIGARQFTVAAQRPLAAGKHRLDVAFKADAPKLGAGGSLTISVDGVQIAQGRIDRTLANFWFTEGLDIGQDTMTPVSDDYTIADSAFDGQIEKITISLDQDPR